MFENYNRKAPRTTRRISGGPRKNIWNTGAAMWSWTYRSAFPFPKTSAFIRRESNNAYDIVQKMDIFIKSSSISLHRLEENGTRQVWEPMQCDYWKFVVDFSYQGRLEVNSSDSRLWRTTAEDSVYWQHVLNGIDEIKNYWKVGGKVVECSSGQF